MSSRRGYGYARLQSSDADVEAYPPPSPSKSSYKGSRADPDARLQRLIVLGAIASLLFVGGLVYACWPGPTEFDSLRLILTGPTWTTIDVTSSHDARLPPYVSESVLAQRLFSPECAERWIAKGELCEELHGKVGRATEGSLDIVWTYVNGTSGLLADWRDALQHNRKPPAPVKPPIEKRAGPPGWRGTKERIAGLKQIAADPGSAARHFRQHNELLFSMRSSLDVAASLVRSRILVTADLPTSEPGKRVGQVPAWLKSRSMIKLRHHWSMFGTRASGNAAHWRDAALPTFNSLAIESQLGHLDTAETILYMNDDSFVTASLQAADLATPLFGPVLRMQQDLPVRGRDGKEKGDSFEGEWPSLGYTNSMLDRRFGTRPRPYATHVSKVFLRPILLEMEAVWGDEFARTGSSRFRGREVDMHVSFLALHYLIEKHRETLLWSFVLGRRPGRQGIIDIMKQAAVPDSVNSKTLNIVWPNRTALDVNSTYTTLLQAGLEQPRTTRFDFLSADGYALAELDPMRAPVPPHGGLGKGMGVSGEAGVPVLPATFDRWPDYRWRPSRRKRACRFDIEYCMPLSVGDKADQLFRRLAFEHVKCGDCIIVALLHLSGVKGLEAFLPPAAASDTDVMNPQPPGGLASIWHTAVFSPPASRLEVVRLLQRYSYCIGMSYSRFINLRTLSGAPILLGQLRAAIRREPPPAFAVVNDDVGLNNQLPGLDRSMLKFFAAQWPKQAPWEYPLPSRDQYFVTALTKTPLGTVIALFQGSDHSCQRLSMAWQATPGLASPPAHHQREGRPRISEDRGLSYPPSQATSPTEGNALGDAYSASRRLYSELDNGSTPGLPRYTSSQSVTSSNLSPLNPSSGNRGSRLTSDYGKAHPLSNSVYADSSPTLVEQPPSSASSFAEKKGYHRTRTSERAADDEVAYILPSQRRREKHSGLSSFYRRLSGAAIADDGRDERHTKPPKLGYLDGIKFLSAVVALNGTLFDATLSSNDYSAIQRSSPLYIVRSFGLALTFFLILTGRCVTASLWESYGQTAPAISWPRLTRAMLIRPFRFVLPVVLIAAIQWGLANAGATDNCNAVGMDRPLWREIRNFAGYATMVFNLFTYFELDTIAAKVFTGNLWTTAWLFQGGYCAYVAHMMLGNLSSNRYWVYGLLGFFSWTTFNYFYLAIIGVVLTDMHVHGQFERVQAWPWLTRLILWAILAGIACFTQFVNVIRNGLNSGFATINVTGHTELQFADSIFAACFLVALETSPLAQLVFGNVVMRGLGKLAPGIYLFAGVLTYTLVPNLALSMHNAGSSGSSILGVSWVALFGVSFGLALPFHFLIELPSKLAGELFVEFVEFWGTEQHGIPPKGRGSRRRDDVKAPISGERLRTAQ